MLPSQPVGEFESHRERPLIVGKNTYYSPKPYSPLALFPLECFPLALLNITRRIIATSRMVIPRRKNINIPTEMLTATIVLPLKATSKGVSKFSVVSGISLVVSE